MESGAATWNPNKLQHHQQQMILTPACPRCGSSNTKFCYYNNYSLTQPRYFCKGCRRYWTKGGSLRNVPIGGGCRKTRRPKSIRLLSPLVKQIDPSFSSSMTTSCIDLEAVYANYVHDKKPQMNNHIDIFHQFSPNWQITDHFNSSELRHQHDEVTDNVINTSKLFLGDKTANSINFGGPADESGEMVATQGNDHNLTSYFMSSGNYYTFHAGDHLGYVDSQGLQMPVCSPDGFMLHNQVRQPATAGHLYNQINESVVSHDHELNLEAMFRF